MATTHSATIGDRGRFVLPSELRSHQGWTQGTPLLIIETSRGVVMTTREQAISLLREQLAGTSLIDELLAERRRSAALDDQAARPEGGA
ncbi:AbrB/MazE/SpoVT family DNA-binding domain-containing protein [Agromyces sp. MMS24-JH15]|uniref:AbrB/MazE/SpoVT family DNA-binding domain-containing protein n=1 Tax=Agromyces sp. MMS24-JH15 TaxID=3243765 RepID=UPI00374976EC